MKGTWQRAVPVYDAPLWTRPFQFFCALGVFGLILVGYREVVGLGPASGMNDAYAWGIWKTFNTMVLTGLGSGALAIGMAAWLFKKDQLHVVMRTAVLTSFLAYIFGLGMLGVDVGRPWNFYWIMAPWRWNLHSPLLEVAVCMSIYATIPLALENVPPALDYLYDRFPAYQAPIKKLEKVIVAGFPFVVGLAYILPCMHQSSLGALMLLGGARVSPLWQTPFLPFLYVWAAAIMGFAFVSATLVGSSLVWKRPLDIDILGEMSRITSLMIGAWLAFRLVDLTVRGQILAAFHFDIYAFLFWVEIGILGYAFYVLRDSVVRRSPRAMFIGALLAAVGGMLYRFDPTTTAFQPKAGAVYFPSAIELLISAGFMSIGIAIFLFLVKTLPILPGSYEMAHEATRQLRFAASPDAPEYATGD